MAHRTRIDVDGITLDVPGRWDAVRAELEAISPCELAEAGVDVSDPASWTLPWTLDWAGVAILGDMMADHVGDYGQLTREHLVENGMDNAEAGKIARQARAMLRELDRVRAERPPIITSDLDLDLDLGDDDLMVVDEYGPTTDADYADVTVTSDTPPAWSHLGATVTHRVTGLALGYVKHDGDVVGPRKWRATLHDDLTIERFAIGGVAHQSWHITAGDAVAYITRAGRLLVAAEAGGPIPGDDLNEPAESLVYIGPGSCAYCGSCYAGADSGVTCAYCTDDDSRAFGFISRADLARAHQILATDPDVERAEDRVAYMLDYCGEYSRPAALAHRVIVMWRAEMTDHTIGDVGTMGDALATLEDAISSGVDPSALVRAQSIRHSASHSCGSVVNSAMAAQDC